MNDCRNTLYTLVHRQCGVCSLWAGQVTSEQPDIYQVNLPYLGHETVKHYEDPPVVPAGQAKIILCVLPATQDFSTQEALTMAKTHDPAGARTIGVVTKIDLSQKAGIRQTLEATAPGCVKLKLGFVAV